MIENHSNFATQRIVSSFVPFYNSITANCVFSVITISASNFKYSTFSAQFSNHCFLPEKISMIGEESSTKKLTCTLDILHGTHAGNNVFEARLFVEISLRRMLVFEAFKTQTLTAYGRNSSVWHLIPGNVIPNIYSNLFTFFLLTSYEKLIWKAIRQVLELHPNIRNLSNFVLSQRSCQSTKTPYDLQVLVDIKTCGDYLQRRSKICYWFVNTFPINKKTQFKNS
uniref:Uncharacterized protein n=1 Tax=Glossina pallidipes TaxID=7398 RepID=A0A1B0AGM8_GLOPL